MLIRTAIQLPIRELVQEPQSQFHHMHPIRGLIQVLIRMPIQIRIPRSIQLPIRGLAWENSGSVLSHEFGCQYTASPTNQLEGICEGHPTKHLNSPAQAPLYECDNCNRSFGSEQALDQHLNSSAHILNSRPGGSSSSL
jgi:hypothetical protein